jgi:hypothetical protein
MKLYPIYYILFTLLTGMLSCKKDTIDLYNGGNYIQFLRNYTDSSLFNFLAVPNKDEAVTPLVVELTGEPVDRDRTYKISVVKELSTATAEDYSLPASFILKANTVKDTAWLNVKKSPAISVKPVKLVLRIEATEDLQVGQADHSINILYISNVVARPDWWDGNVESNYLGSYSDKKYLLFIQVTGQADLDSQDELTLRYHTIRFKNYLLREKDAGRTVYEENGQEMTVPLIGG